ncbi:hypothetical protein SSPS47_28710 [Streptomyces sp. S4.7]|nr:hypothetical protein SSPS47_28710 [Streptomyces sp. S4.7]
MTDIAAADWWGLLPAGVREQVDGYVLQDDRMRAVRAVFEAGRARGMGLVEAQLVVHERYLVHGDRIARTPESPLDLESPASSPPASACSSCAAGGFSAASGSMLAPTPYAVPNVATIAAAKAVILSPVFIGVSFVRGHGGRHPLHTLQGYVVKSGSCLRRIPGAGMRARSARRSGGAATRVVPAPRQLAGAPGGGAARFPPVPDGPIGSCQPCVIQEVCTDDCLCAGPCPRSADRSCHLRGLRLTFLFSAPRRRACRDRPCEGFPVVSLHRLS